MKKFFIIIFILLMIIAVILLIQNNIVLNITDTKRNNVKETKQGEIEEIADKSKYSNEIFGNHYEKAEELMKNMTIEEKVGQMFLVRYPEKGVINQIKEHQPGGYILFGRDFDNKTKKQMIEELEKNQVASKINMIFGVDEEGGTVVRVSNHKKFRNSKFQSPQELWSKGKLEAIIKDSKEKSNLLKSIGINMNLTPIADVPTKKTSFIYKRSYGKNATETATYVAELIKIMNESKMISVMKHFPGYGDNVDTHTEIAIDKRPYSTFQQSDFIPFQKGIEVGAPCILVNHNIINSMDKEIPASLSSKVHEILRDELKFTGMIITDDLAMDAVKNYVENEEAAVQAVLAGNDMIISSDFVKQKQEILNAIKKGKIEEKTINEAVKRILACKCAYGIIK